MNNENKRVQLFIYKAKNENCRPVLDLMVKQGGIPEPYLSHQGKSVYSQQAFSKYKTMGGFHQLSLFSRITSLG